VKAKMHLNMKTMGQSYIQPYDLHSLILLWNYSICQHKKNTEYTDFERHFYFMHSKIIHT